MEEKGISLEDLLSIGIGIFAGLMIIDIIISRKNSHTEITKVFDPTDDEYIVTSRGRKLYVSEVTKRRIEAVSKKT